MKQRGRKSSQLVAVQTIAEIVAIEERPVPPLELDAEESEEWNAVVSRLPAKWFPRETHGLLVQYCRHVVIARRIAVMIRMLEGRGIEGGGEAFDLKKYNDLLLMQDRESRAISHLAVKMRIAQQSTIDKEAKKAGSGLKPWDGHLRGASET